MVTKRMTRTVEAERAPVPIRDEIDLDPQSLWFGYRRWSELSKARGHSASPSHVDIQFRAALQRLRNTVERTGPLMLPSTMGHLQLPRLTGFGTMSDALRAELWRRQMLFNEAVQHVVNLWPTHAQSPAAVCWLKDEIRPHIASFPMPGVSHRGGLLARAAIRAAKLASTTALAVTHLRHLRTFSNANALLYRGLMALVTPDTLPEPDLEELVDALVALSNSQRLIDAPGWGAADQARFLREAALAIAGLLLPAEACLESLYTHWRTRHDRAREAQATDPVSGLVTVLLVTPTAATHDKLMASLSCQRSRWECFSQANGRQTVAASDSPPLPLAQIRARLKGDWVALVTEPATFGPWAMEDVLRQGQQDPRVELIYSDHDEQLDSGALGRPFFKPAWSPDLFLEANYLGGVVFVARSTFDAWAKDLTKVTTADVWRLVLACHARSAKIARIPEVLWHRLSPAPVEDDAHTEAVAGFLRDQPVDAELRRTESGRHVSYRVKGRPLVSLVVPFKDKPELLEQLLTSLAANEPYQAYELILVSNNSKNRATLRYLSTLKDPRIKVHEWNHPFNYQELNNAAVKWCSGDYLLFLNNDVSWGEGGALAEMLGHCQRKEIGAVGANLKYPNGRLQHSGVVLGPGGFAAHAFGSVRPNAKWTAFGLPSWTRNYLAVTAACMMVRRDVFEEVGGFDEDFVVSGGDVDLCLRIGAKGYRVLNTPHVSLFHHESATRSGMTIPDADAWKSYQSFHAVVRDGDPFYNPNLTLTSMDCLPRLDERSGEELAHQFLSMVLTSSRTLLQG